jgi:hypothetical protein
MSQSISTVSVLVGYTALQAFAGGGSAISPEADAISKAATAIVKSVEESQVLFGAKAEAISRLVALADEYIPDETCAIHPGAVFMAERFVRALPDSISPPEFSAEPDGSISLDWIESRKPHFFLERGSE